VAFFTTHAHQDTLNIPHQYIYVYKYSIEVDEAVKFIQLPVNESIKIFALTLATNPYDRLQPASPLYDDFTGRKGFSLSLDKRIVTEDMNPVATVSSVRKRNLTDLPFRVSRKDYADIIMPNGVLCHYYYSGTEKLKQNQPKQGMLISSVNDGMFDMLAEDSLKVAWFEQGEGRYIMDLQKITDIDSLHIFSVLDTKRGAPAFSIWVSKSETMPSVTGDLKPGEWQFVARANPVDIWGNSNVVYSVTTPEDMPLTGRYLMWATEDCQHGPYLFREVDVFDRQ
jgi:hypothetical protein